MKPSRLVIASALLLLAATLLACNPGGAGPAAQPTSPPAEVATNAPVGKPTAAPPASTSAPEATVAAAPTEETFQATKLTEGLAALNSYRAVFTMKFDGTEDGKPSKWTFEIQWEGSKNPPATRMAYLGSGEGQADIAQLSGFEVVQIGDMQYIKFGEGEGNCMSSSTTESTTPTEMFKPEDVLGGLSSSRRAGPDETVNGVRAHHYTFDEKALLGLSGLAQAKGEVWVAVDGNYVVKYTLSAEGKDVLFGKANSEGKLDWTYEVSDVNKPLDIKPPAGCEGQAQDIPIMADATDKTTMGTMITYKSASKLEDVIAFYKEQMPKNGWKASEGEPLITDEMAMLDYEKEGSKSSVTITLDKDSGQVSVLISVEKQP